MIECEKLEFEHRHFKEPLFCRLALYDLHSEAKISEDFHFHLNGVEELELLSPLTVELAVPPQLQAIFTLSNANPEVVLVLFVERIMLSSVDEARKPYVKKKVSGDKYQRLQGQISGLRYVRQSFLWGYTSLYQRRHIPTQQFSRRRVEMAEGAVTISPLFKMPDAAFDPIPFLKRQKMEKNYINRNFDTVPATFHANITRIHADSTQLLDQRPKTHIDTAELDRIRSSGTTQNKNASHAFSANNDAQDRDTNEEDEPDEDEEDEDPTERGSVDSTENNISQRNNATETAHQSDDETDATYLETEREGDHDPHPFTDEDDQVRQLHAQFDFYRRLASVFRTVEEFGALPPRTPSLKPINSLYLYPQNVKLGRFARKTRTLIKVLLRDNDTSTDDTEGLKRCFQRYSSERRHHFALTVGHYSGARHLHFQDEIRIDLPIPITRSHHILFVIYQVNKKKESKKKKKKNPVPDDEDTLDEDSLGNIDKSICGYAFLPLVNTSTQGDKEYPIINGVNTLTVYKQLKSNYLSTPMSNSGSAMHVQTHLHSSIYPQEPALSGLFSNANIVSAIDSPGSLPRSSEEASLERVMSNISRAMVALQRSNFSKLLSYAPVLFNMLLETMCRVDQYLPGQEFEGLLNSNQFKTGVKKFTRTIIKAQTDTFQTMLCILKGFSAVLNDSTRRNSILSSFTQYIFNLNSLSSSNIYVYLCKYWLFFMKIDTQSKSVWINVPKQQRQAIRRRASSFKIKSASEPQPESSWIQVTPIVSLQFSWFFFDIMAKSIALRARQETGVIKKVSDPSFNNYFIAMMTHRYLPLLLKSKEPHVEEANYHLALFLRDLAPVYDLKALYKFVTSYISTVNNNPQRSVHLTLEFFQVFADYEHFASLSSPDGVWKEENDESIADMFIGAVCAGLKSKHHRNDVAINIFVEHITKLDHDSRFQEPQKRAVLAQIYFRFVDEMVKDQHNMLRNLENKEKQLECLLCVIHLLGNFQPNQLYEWWDRNDAYYLYHFLILLNTAAVNLSRISDTVIKDSAVRVVSNVFYHFSQWLSNGLDRLQQIPPRKTSPRPPPSPSVPASKKASIPNPQRDTRRLMMECSSFVRNFMLTSTYQDQATFRNAIFSSISEFVNSFATILADAEPQSFINQHVNINHITHNNNAWQWRKILGAFLAHSTFPFNSLETHYLTCLNNLIDAYTDEIFGEFILSHENTGHFVERETNDEKRDNSNDNNNNNNNNNKQEEKDENDKDQEKDEENNNNVNQPEQKQESKDEDKTANETSSPHEPESQSSSESSLLRSSASKRLRGSLANPLFKTTKLPELVFKLAKDDQEEGEDFAWTFFLTYLSFTEPLEVLMLTKDFCDYFMTQDSVAPILRLCRSVNYWLLHFFDDFDNRSIAYAVRLLDYLMTKTGAKSSSNSSESLEPSVSELKDIANEVRVTLTKKLLGLKKDAVPEISVRTPEPILPRHAQPAQLWKPSFNFELPKYAEHPRNPFDFTFNIMEWDSVELARQLTLIEASLFRKIRPHEFFEQAWMSTQREVAAPNITLITKRFNSVNLYLQSLILSEQSKTRRKNLIMKLIEVGEACLSMKNFNTVAQIVSALNSSPIDRLRRTWENVDVNRFVKLSQLLVHPFTRLRKEMNHIKESMGTQDEEASVPFLGYYLTELAVVDHKLPNTINDGINFGKWQQYADILKAIHQMQCVAYSYKTIPFLKWYFTRQMFRNLKSEEQLWIQSNELETRTHNAPDVESVNSIITPRPSSGDITAEQDEESGETRENGNRNKNEDGEESSNKTNEEQQDEEKGKEKEGEESKNHDEENDEDKESETTPLSPQPSSKDSKVENNDGTDNNNNNDNDDINEDLEQDEKN